MLRIFLGENQNEKLRRCALDMKERLLSGGSVIAVVPDQFSFDFDKALYQELGAKDFNRVTVLSFRRLSESLIERFGTREGTLISQNERKVIIWLALRRVRAEKCLRFLEKAAEKPAFCEDMSRLADRLRRAGISPSDLESASEKLSGALKDKLFDISKIYGAYLELLKERSLRDESSIITEGARIASESGFFSGSDVFVERFDSFSPDELLMLRAAVKDSRTVTVNLGVPFSSKRSAVSPYLHCEATQRQLTELAASLNVPLKYLDCDLPRTENAVLSGVGECLFAPIKSSVKNDGSISIVRAENMYEEAEYVAAQIRRLVTREGFSFNDIAVITHDIESYSGVLEAAFERFGITAFIDRPQPAAGMSLVLFALDALEAAATRSPDTDKILKYLRSPFSPLSQEEVSLLWDYCVKWNVDGEMWKSDFTGADDALETVNSARKKAITPLLKLHDAAKSATAKEVAEAFCEFLRETELAERAYKVIEDCAEDGLKLETARLFKQLWNAVMSAVSEVYLAAGEEKITLRAFADLLRLMLMQTTVASPPQKLDSVTVADVERSIIREPRAAFVVGLADGAFPADVRKSGLFSGRDLAELEAVGVCFDITPEAGLNAERFDCYKALTAPSERLYLSWSGTDLRGKELRPSRFIRRITQFCGAEVKSALSLGTALYSSTPAAAYYACAVSRNCTPSEKAAIYGALSEIPEYREKLRRLGGISDSRHSLAPEISQKLFAAKDINVTASRIDVYNRCPFEYFCKYGLKIEPVKPMAVDPANRGTVMHFLFQSVLEYYGESFSEATDEELAALVDRLLKEFSDRGLGGDFGKTAKFRADYARLGGAALEILFNMREEFKVSKFRPARFEYDLNREDGGSVLTVPIGRGVSVKIRGVVDRVDTYVSPEGKRYIRVVDYKTGSKKFCLEDIYNGINLQLLLYMLALTEGSDADFKDCIPSGILYMRAGFLECKDNFDPLSEDSKSRLKRTAEQLKRNGLIVGIDEAIEAMDSTFGGQFVPVKKKSNGDYTSNSELISPESFKLLEDFAKRKVEEFGRCLIDGRIDAVPAGDSPDELECSWCEYFSVCNRKKYLMKIISGNDAEKLKAEIGEGGGENV